MVMHVYTLVLECPHSMHPVGNLEIQPFFFFFQVIIGNRELSTLQCVLYSGVAGGVRVPPLTVKNLPKRGENQEKQGKIWKKRQKSGRLLTSPLLADRAGYATGPIEGFGNPDLFTSSDHRKSG